MDDYEEWVDNLIKSHKEKLDGLKSSKFSENKHTYPTECRGAGTKYDNEINVKKLNNLNDDYKAIKLRRIEKLYDDMITENAQLKLWLKEKDNIINELKVNCNMHERDNKTNSLIFLEREKDLIETLKILDIDNRRLEEKVKELNAELNKKSKDLDLALSLNKEYNFCNSPLRSRSANPNEDDVHLLVIKLEKIIEIFTLFFTKNNKNDNINQLVKSFDYESIRIKLLDYEKMFIFTEANEKISYVSNSKNDKSRNLKMNNDIDNNSTLKKSNSNVTLINSDKNKQIKTNKIHEKDTIMILKLDQRLKDLENNFCKIITDRDKKNNVKTPRNKEKTNINNKNMFSSKEISKSSSRLNTITFKKNTTTK